MNYYIFSDLSHILNFFRVTENIAICADDFFDFNKKDDVITQKVTSKSLHFIASEHKTKVVEKGFSVRYSKQVLKLNRVRCEGFTDQVYFYTTLSRFLKFLEAIGLIYRPDLHLPPLSQKSVKCHDIYFFPHSVYQKFGKELICYKASGLNEKDFIYSESSKAI